MQINASTGPQIPPNGYNAPLPTNNFNIMINGNRNAITPDALQQARNSIMNNSHNVKKLARHQDDLNLNIKLMYELNSVLKKGTKPTINLSIISNFNAINTELKKPFKS